MSGQKTKKFVPIRGNTFPVKDRLKAIGGYWNAEEKCWYVPAEQRMVAQVIVGNAPQVEQLPGLEDAG